MLMHRALLPAVVEHRSGPHRDVCVRNSLQRLPTHRLAKDSDRFDVEPLNLATKPSLTIRKRPLGRVQLAPIPAQQQHSIGSQQSQGALPTHTLHCGAPGSRLRRHSSKSAPTSTRKGSSTRVSLLVEEEEEQQFWSLPLPEELLPLDDAPVHVFHSVMTMRDSRRGDYCRH